MRKVWHQRSQQSAAHAFLAASTCILLGLLLAGCGSTATASSGRSSAATATSTCPPVTPVKAVSGTVRTVSSGSFTVVSTSDATSTVHYTSTTRFTRQGSGSTANLVTGQSVLVSTDSSGVTALRVVVIGTTSGSTGGRFGFGGSGTPVARGSARCFRRTTGAGTGFGQGSGTFSGIRGTLSTITNSQLVVTDSQGQTYTVSVTSSTIIISLSSATAGDVAQGDTVTASGTATSDGITARTVMIEIASTTSS